MPTKLTHEDVRVLFDYWKTGESDKFMDRLVDDIHWTVMGSHPLAGEFHNKADYFAGALNRLSRVLTKTVSLDVVAIYVDGMTAIVELKSALISKNGMPYNNSYCWILKFNDDKQVTSIKAYLDSALLKEVIESNERDLGIGGSS